MMAEVVASPVSRLVTQELPQMNAEGTPVAVVTDAMLFSDTVLQVLEVYSGTVPTAITVMQTGGVSPSTGNVEGPIDDPLYEVGEVYVLFLVDITGDPIQAPDAERYRTVSPAGRFLLDGSSVRSYWLDEQVRAVQPTTLEDLLAQIRQASP
ncbi:MAG TPA: hypothetical protein PLC98_23370 [Anaerolineales bacterium]|nr:hypothetical protein [Anaerolineales bacterium]